MKKSYVKPVMESEAFVANEYVGSCWYVVCDQGHTAIVSLPDDSEPTFDRNGLNPDSDGDGFGDFFGTKVYFGKMSGSIGDFFDNFHTLTDDPIKIDKDNCGIYNCRPNAS